MTNAGAFTQLSSEAFAALGAQNIAYVKPISEQDQLKFEVHGADGTPFATFESMDVAFAAVRQNGLEPLSVH
jgi:hypothetical protein